MATIITIWIDALEGLIPNLSCCLGCSDNTSGVGWLHRANFNPITQPVHEECSRHFARIMMMIRSTLYSQHQTGKHNDIADLLSRWHFLTNKELTFFLKSKFESQMPSNFQIYPLRKEISSWIISTLERLKLTTQSQTQHIQTKNEHGNDGSPGWQRWAGSETPILLGLKEIKKSEWSEPLLSLSGGVNTVLLDTQTHWSLARSTRPYQTWQRPFRTTITQTQDSTRMVKYTVT